MPRAPKHPSVRGRRNAANAGFRSLPVGGRVGPVPVWPLADDVRRVAQLEDARDRVLDLQVRLEAESDARVKGRLRRDLSKYQLVAATVELQLEQARDAEVALWGDLWRMPQAVMWEESSAGREVAQYVRWKIRGEQGDLESAKEARMLSDRLGLNPLALLRLRLEIERVAEAEETSKRRRDRGAVGGESRGPDDGEDPRSIFSVVS